MQTQSTRREESRAPSARTAVASLPPAHGHVSRGVWSTRAEIIFRGNDFPPRPCAPTVPPRGASGSEAGPCAGQAYRDSFSDDSGGHDEGGHDEGVEGGGGEGGGGGGWGGGSWGGVGGWDSDAGAGAGGAARWARGGLLLAGGYDGDDYLRDVHAWEPRGAWRPAPAAPAAAPHACCATLCGTEAGLCSRRRRRRRRRARAQAGGRA
jgi:hypothetical protein